MEEAGTASAEQVDYQAGDDQPEGTDVVFLHYTDEYWNRHPQDLANPDSNNTFLLSNGTKPDLWQLNREWAVRLVPLQAVLAVLVLLSIVSNSVAVFVYYSRFRRNTASLFVVFVAVLDLVCIILGSPMEMATLALPLVYDSPIACKIARFVETWAVCVSLLALAAVAWDRHCKLFRSASFLTLRRAKWLCVAVVVVAVLVASPALMVFGSQRVPTGVSGVVGVTCGTDNAMSTSPSHVVYIALLLVTFTFSFLTMTVLYSLMLARIWRRRTAGSRERVSPARHSYPRKHRFVTEDSVSSCGGSEETRKLPTSSSTGSGVGVGMGVGGLGTPRMGRSSQAMDPARVPLKSGVKESARIGQAASSSVDVQSTRMTWIFFIVSVVCVLSVLPHLVMRTLLAATHLLDNLTNPVVMQVYHVAVRSYFLHAAIKPLVYLACNHSFRRECRHLLLKLPLGSACAGRGDNSSAQRS